MRLITWNINSVRLRVDLVRRLIEEANPDVLCLQETKTPDELFPREMFEGLGYRHMLVHGMKGYNGVAILAREPFVSSTTRAWCARADCRHAVALTPDGLLARLAGTTEIMVNSLHGQGIDRPAPDLVVEAVAPDGQIEAVSLPNARFVVGVQWHPEYKPLENPFSRALFAAFAQACHATTAGTATKRRAA